MGLNNQFDICYDCSEEEIEITSMDGTEKEFIRVRICGRGEVIGEPHRCGFYDFCKDCKKKFICATERK